MSNVDQRIMYFYPKQTKKNQKRKVISGVVMEDRIVFGKAECSLRDRYVKKTGREIARSRAISNECLLSAKIINPNKLTKQFIALAKVL